MSITLNRYEQSVPLNALTSIKLKELYKLIDESVTKAFEEYLDKNGIKPEEDEYAKLKESWLKKENKTVYKRFNEVYEEILKRNEAEDTVNKKVLGSQVDLDSLSSEYNSERHKAAETEYEDASRAAEERQTNINLLEEQIIEAKAKNDLEKIASLQSSLAKDTSTLADLEGQIKATEKAMKEFNKIVDNHNSVISSLSLESEELATVIDASVKAYDSAKDGVSLDFSAEICRQIVLGQESSDDDILAAINKAALEGRYSFTFEADLWSWNNRTLKTLSDAGFILDLTTSTNKYGKDGKLVGTQDIPTVGALRRTFRNTDLTVSWFIEQPAGGKK